MSRRAIVRRRIATKGLGATPIAYSVADAAQVIGIGVTKLNELIRSGELPSITIGRRRLVPVEDLTAFVSALRRTKAHRV